MICDACTVVIVRFSPRNGEIILKETIMKLVKQLLGFQSPQWGDNSKEYKNLYCLRKGLFQSPQWGDNSKV